jgi:hypothetical protein
MIKIKGKIVVVLFYIFFINLDIHSLELWQGFSDDMSSDDVLTRAKIIFGDNIRTRNETDIAINQFGFPKEIQRGLFWDLPIPNLNIAIVGIKNYSQDFPELDYVSFYFFESKLAYVVVKWYNSTTDDLLPILNRQFGRTMIFQYTSVSGRSVQAYRWVNQGRDIILDRGSIFYFNSNFNTEYNNRRAEEQKRKKEIEEEEQRKRRDALNNIQL